MTDHTDQRSPDEIERDIRATQDEMSRTARQIEGELSPRNIIDSLLEKAGQEGVDSRYLIDAARRNPLALGMIAIGGLWLVSDADARPSALKLKAGRSHGKDGNVGDDSWQSEHRSYVEHMSRCEPHPGEDDEAYRRRRDHNRASYLMMERGHEEDEGTFRKRLDEATEKMRQRRERMSERTHDFASHSRERTQAFASQSRERSRQAMDDAKGLYFDNPLMGGLAAAFVGAVAGSALPATRTEEDCAGSLGEKAIDAVGAKARQAGDHVRDRKDDMLDRIDDKVSSSGKEQSHQLEDGEGGGISSSRFA